MYDIIIIGGGPAGLTAGLYACRGAMKALLVEKIVPGGLIAMTERVENYPAFPDGISGYDLSDKMLTQAKKFGLEIANGEVKEITHKDNIFTVRTTSSEYKALSVILAMGTTARNLGVPDEAKFTGRGISYCATCDAFFFKDKDVIVVGGGDAAVEEGIFLTKFAKSVSLVHRRDKLRAQPIIQERAFKNPKMKFYWNSVSESIIGKDKIEGLKVKDTVNGKITEIKADGIFIFIGFTPNTEFLKDFVKLDESGFIITDIEMRTSRTGVYACGDAIKKSLRQVVTACGDGATASFNAQKYVDDIKQIK
jgi:thioredoxin reductase (NADPH)